VNKNFTVNLSTFGWPVGTPAESLCLCSELERAVQ